MGITRRNFFAKILTLVVGADVVVTACDPVRFHQVIMPADGLPKQVDENFLDNQIGPKRFTHPVTFKDTKEQVDIFLGGTPTRVVILVENDEGFTELYDGQSYKKLYYNTDTKQLLK